MELNVSRLAGLVVAFDRVLGEQMPDEESMFRGVNFVFDGRGGKDHGKPIRNVANQIHPRINSSAQEQSSRKVEYHPHFGPLRPSPLEPGTLTRKIAQAPKGVIRLNTVTQRELACDGTCTIE